MLPSNDLNPPVNMSEHGSSGVSHTVGSVHKQQTNLSAPTDVHGKVGYDSIA